MIDQSARDRAQIAADTAAHQHQLSVGAGRVRAEWVATNPQRAQELRQARDVAQEARREARAAHDALAAHKATPPTSREALGGWKDTAIGLAAEAEGLAMLADQAEQRLAALERGASVDAARFAQGKLADARGQVEQRIAVGVKRLQQLRQELDAAAAEVERDVYALYSDRVVPYGHALVALGVEHEPDHVWRSRLGLANGWAARITR